MGKEKPYHRAMIISRLTSTAQTTIPKAVRTALALRAGDELAYVIEQGRVVLTRFDGNTQGDDPFAVFSEWTSEADAHAYAGL
jgi:antitoxin PrlF